MIGFGSNWALLIVTERDPGGLFWLSDICSKTGRLVLDILLDKHPDAVAPTLDDFDVHPGPHNSHCLVVDDFGIKAMNKAHVLHLKDALEEHYHITVNWTGSLFIGITLTWDYINCFVDLHMPLYIDKAVLKYQHPKPDRPQHLPYKNAPIQYGATVQRVPTDDFASLSLAAIKWVQDIVGTLLYYAQAVNSTLLTALSAIAVQQANGTKAVGMLLHSYARSAPLPQIRTDPVTQLRIDVQGAATRTASLRHISVHNSPAATTSPAPIPSHYE